MLKLKHEIIYQPAVVSVPVDPSDWRAELVAIVPGASKRTARDHVIDSMATAGVMTMAEPAEADRQLVFLPRVNVELFDPEDRSRATQLAMMARALARDGGLFHVREAVTSIEAKTACEAEYLKTLWESWRAGRPMTGWHYHDKALVNRPRFRRALADYGLTFEPSGSMLARDEARWVMMSDDAGFDTEAAAAGGVEIAFRLADQIKD